MTHSKEFGPLRAIQNTGPRAMLFRPGKDLPVARVRPVSVRCILPVGGHRGFLLPFPVTAPEDLA